MARSDSSRPLALALLSLLWVSCSSNDPPAAGNAAGAGASGSAGAAGDKGKGLVGGPCSAQSPCQQGECRTRLEYVPLPEGSNAYGWCSPSCSSNDDCPGGFRCTQAGGQRVCMPRCTDHGQCSLLESSWKCAEAGGERVCADPKGPRGEIQFTTKIAVKSVYFGAKANYRLVPGFPIEFGVTFENRGSSGPVDATGMVIKSESEWLKFEGDKLTPQPGIPVDTPLQLTAVLADPIGVGTVEVPIFLRSWKPSLSLFPDMALQTDGKKEVGLQGLVSGVGYGLGLRAGGAGSPESAGAAFDLADPFMTEAPRRGSLGVFAPPFSSSILGVEIFDPSGSSWPGTADVVTALEGLAFPPDPVKRSELAGGKSVSTYFRLRYQPSKTEQAGLPVSVSIDVPWAKVEPPTAKIWNGETAFTVTVSEPDEPGSCRGWVKIDHGSPNGRGSYLPVLVFPD